MFRTDAAAIGKPGHRSTIPRDDKAGLAEDSYGDRLCRLGLEDLIYRNPVTLVDSIAPERIPHCSVASPQVHLEHE